MLISDASMAADGRTIYTAEDLRVGLFSSSGSFQERHGGPAFTGRLDRLLCYILKV